MPKLKDRRNYWSESHRWYLVRIAISAWKRFGRPAHIDIDELVNIGWYQAARRVTKKDLRICGKNAKLAMYYYMRKNAMPTSLEGGKTADEPTWTVNQPLIYGFEVRDAMLEMAWACSGIPQRRIWLEWMKTDDRRTTHQRCRQAARRLGKSPERVRQVVRAIEKKTAAV